MFCLLLGGCGTATPRPTQVTPITQAQAFEAASKWCQRVHIRQIDPPRQVEAHLMSRQQAEFLQGCAKSDCAGSPPTPEPAEALVWLVTLEGRWQLVGGPEPTRTPTGQPPMPTSEPLYFYRCQTIVDATTGAVGPILNF